MYREGVSQVVYSRRGAVAVLLTNPRSGAQEEGENRLRWRR